MGKSSIEIIEYSYKYIPTIRAFTINKKRIKCILGPYGCLPGDVEFLTPEGWKKISEYSEGDLVAQWEGGQVEFISPLEYIVLPADGWIEFSGNKYKHLYMKVSREHRIPHYNRAGQFSIKTAEEIAYSPGRISIPVPFKSKGKLWIDETTNRRYIPPDENEKKYCFVVPSSFFIVRQNDVVYVTGNSGKSSGCVMHLLRSAQRQPPSSNGVRYTRYAIVRNTLKELKDTTKKTIDEWIDPLRPKWRESENKYIIEFRLTDGTIVHSEWLLRALDRPDQIKDLLSLEISGAWINEAREIPKEVFDVIDGRIDRYPSQRMGGCSYPYIILDSNPPDTENWLYHYFEEKRIRDPEVREKAELFRQPSGLSREAENLPNLPKNYYKNLAIGKDPDFIRVYIHGEYGYIREGKPVFPNFIYNIHVSKDTLFPIRSIPLTIGMDFGLFPACVVTQVIPDGRLYVYDEIVSEDAMDLETLVKERLQPLLMSEKYRGIRYVIIGDPAGQARSQIDRRTCFTTLRSIGIKAYPAFTNSLITRIQAVNNYLTRMIRGEPAFSIDPSCKVLIQALVGKYCFKKLRVSGERYAELPDKNFWSHVSDALTYACLGYSPSQSISQTYSNDFFDSQGHPIDTNPRTIIRPGGWF